MESLNLSQNMSTYVELVKADRGLLQTARLIHIHQ